jgi:hypothetical protein
MTPSIACRLCQTLTAEPDSLCSGCKHARGPRVASTLARALADSSYASACLASLPREARAKVRRAVLRAQSRQRCDARTLNSTRREPRWVRVGTDASALVLISEPC